MRFPIRDLLLTLGVFTASGFLVWFLTSIGPGPAGPAGGGGGGTVAESGVAQDNAAVAAALNDAMANVVERTLPGVVSVHTDRQEIVLEHRLRGGLPLESVEKKIRQPGVGSGVIISRDGLVLTNWHVVQGVDVLIRVTLHGDEEPRKATLVDKDESVDIALLRIEPRRMDEEFPWMIFGDSDLMRPGHFVFAVGAPLNLPETVTQGIISNRARRVSDTLDSYLQTDCTINPGNSGGPLVNLKGELIGINTRLVIGPQESASGQAYGLAIPSNEVQDAYERMINKGRPRGYLGVTVDDWPDMSYQSGRQPECAVVVGVDKGSPAAAAGLQKDDLIVSMDAEPVRSSGDFFRRLRKRQVGETLQLGLKRAEQKLTVSAVVVDLKTIFEAEEVPTSRVLGGLTVRGLRRAERAGFALPEKGGLLIEAVAEDSPLKGKLLPGEVILRVSEQAQDSGAGVQDMAQFEARMEAIAGQGGFLTVLRARGGVEVVSFGGKS
ncbi:MAG: serine protease [Verrucomicrobiales bacterium]|nr:serine protease [Verrucomicrobiales bacterium]